MKKVLYLLMALFMATAFISCSDDDDTSSTFSGNKGDDDSYVVKGLNESLLSGYWIQVKDGVRQNNGAWFLNEPQNTIVEFFSLPNGIDSPALLKAFYPWYVNTDDVIVIATIEGVKTTVVSLTNDKMSISRYDTNNGQRVVDEYERISGPIEIKN